ncbi:hypothetical protein QN277_027076 [Acacia crassicarpa]|uniref:HR-like lesion-inducer n=1 Tax=Acacia crassicarpa TaxID=499986 RepID=A0AAE1MFZ0_9FABA|nr:hypothetical protein QN277_027076 [Acacia crassicarpa]
MAFASFVGRVLFASLFIVSAWQEFNDFGKNGGPAAQALEPKFHTFSNQVSTHSGFKLPTIAVKDLVAVSIFLKGVGGLLFIFGNALGAYLLLLHQAIFTPLLCDFYNYDTDTKEFTEHFLKFTQSLALFGALLFYIGMRNSMPRRQLRKKAPKDKTV